MDSERHTPTVERKAMPLRLIALAVALGLASPVEALFQPSAEPGTGGLAGRDSRRGDQQARDEAHRARDAASAQPASGIPLHRPKIVSSVLDDGHVLQEADGTVAEHPGYRRYHFGYGPLSVTDTNGKRFIQTDALGSATDLTSTTGAIASMRKYDAWGSYRDATAPTSADEKLGYTGHQYDPETGLVYARARYYDPELGRFISRDSFEGTLFEAPSLHRFMYVRANPLRYRDPSGHSDTAADAAREWEAQRAEYQKWLATQITPEDSGAKRMGLAFTTLSVELGAGMMDLFKLGEGAAEGGWRGWGRDTLRAVALGLLVKGSGRIAEQQGAPRKTDVARVVEEPSAPSSASVEAPKVGKPAPAASVEVSVAPTSRPTSSPRAEAAEGAATAESGQPPGAPGRAPTRDAGAPEPAARAAREPESSSGTGVSGNATPKNEPVVYRQGTFADESIEWEGNFLKGRQWASDNPLSTPDYAKRYGLPAENTGSPDWVVRGQVQGPYRTRPAPPSHNSPANTGGATEVLPDDPNGVVLDWFHMP